jgi:glycosyltransferase involved in cell wall biosynthesis
VNKTLLFYSDCAFFAGCENMLANFFNDTQFTDTYDILFIYRWTQAYEEGFQKRVFGDIDHIPLRLHDHYDLYNSVDKFRNRYLRKAIKIGINILMIKYIFLILNTIMLYRTIRNRHIDMVHINNGGYPGAYGTISMVIAARLGGIRHVVYVVNNIAVGYRSPERWLDYPFDRIVVRMVSVFITGSNYAGNTLRKILRIPPEKILSIPNGIAKRTVTETREQIIARLHIPGDRPLLSVIAVLDERKGQIFLLQALSEIKKSHPPIMPYCVIEGKGPTEALLRKFTCEHDLEDDILFVRNEPQIFNLINASDCIILPSIRNEDFPNIILESMSLGKAVIASNISGIPEQLDHMRSGILTEPQDIHGLVAAIRLISEDAALRNTLGKNAKMKFDEFYTDKKAIKQYCKIYTKLDTEVSP